MGKIKETEDRIKEEQSLDMRAEWFKETGKQEILIEDKESEVVTLGSSFEDDSFVIEFEEEKAEEVELPTTEEDEEKEVLEEDEENSYSY